MAVISFGLKNILQFYTTISPFIITGYTLLSSVRNYDAKGFVYIIGLMISSVFLLAGKQMLKGYDDMNQVGTNPHLRGDFCNVFRGPFEDTLGYVTRPSSRAWFHGFTAAYFLMGVIMNKYNDGLVFSLSLASIGFADLAFRYISGCDRGIANIFFSWLVAAFIGALWFFGIYSINTEESLTYFGKEKSKKCNLSNVNYSCSFKK
jgi:hypothetical protein